MNRRCKGSTELDSRVCRGTLPVYGRVGTGVYLCMVELEQVKSKTSDKEFGKCSSRMNNSVYSNDKSVKFAWKTTATCTHPPTKISSRNHLQS